MDFKKAFSHIIRIFCILFFCAGILLSQETTDSKKDISWNNNIFTGKSTDSSNTAKSESIIGNALVPEIGLRITLPPKWDDNPLTFVNDELKAYFYTRDWIIDSAGMLARVVVQVTLQDIPDSVDFILYSQNLKSNPDVKVLEYYSPLDSISKLSPCIAFLAEYTDQREKKKYKSYFLDTKRNGKGVRIVVGSNIGAFNMLKQEYFFILQTLKFD